MRHQVSVDLAEARVDVFPERLEFCEKMLFNIIKWRLLRREKRRYFLLKVC